METIPPLTYHSSAPPFWNFHQFTVSLLHDSPPSPPRTQLTMCSAWSPAPVGGGRWRRRSWTQYWGPRPPAGLRRSKWVRGTQSATLRREPRGKISSIVGVVWPGGLQWGAARGSRGRGLRWRVADTADGTTAQLISWSDGVRQAISGIGRGQCRIVHRNRCTAVLFTDVDTPFAG